LRSPFFFEKMLNGAKYSNAIFMPKFVFADNEKLFS